MRTPKEETHPRAGRMAGWMLVQPFAQPFAYALQGGRHFWSQGRACDHVCRFMWFATSAQTRACMSRCIVINVLAGMKQQIEQVHQERDE